MVNFLIEQLPIFQDISPAVCAKIAPLFVPCEFNQGQMLFGQGDRAEFLYLLVNGEVAVRFKPDDGPSLTVAHVCAGGVVGWSAVLGSPFYTSSVDCLIDCQCLRLQSDELRDPYEQDPETGTLVLERLAIVIAERLRNTYSHVLDLLEQGLRLGTRKHYVVNRVSSHTVQT